jgi:hypothetical protein
MLDVTGSLRQSALVGGGAARCLVLFLQGPDVLCIILAGAVDAGIRINRPRCSTSGVHYHRLMMKCLVSP